MKSKGKRFCSAVLSVLMLLSLWCAPLQASAADYDWGSLLKQSAEWYGSAEGIALADDILTYQHADGGWKKDMAGDVSGSWGKSTTDNDATTSQITILARVYQQTGTQKYLEGCQKGIDLLLNGQYDNGGWPQVFDDAGTYHAHITYNDGAMIRVLNIMRACAEKSGDFTFMDDARSARAKIAMDKGIECILNTQIEVNGVLTAWCQQHDEFTLAPASARAYELPSISASESVGIVEFLKKIENPSAQIVNSINSAVRWMTDSAIYGIKVVSTEDDRIVVEEEGAGPIWARFYDIDTNQPMFVDRDGSIHSAMAELSQERRTGYAWYGTWPKNLVNAGYVEFVPTVLNGTLIRDLEVQDTVNTADWSIQYDLSAGNAVFGDRDVTFATLPEALSGAEYIRLACDAKSITTDLATFTAAADITVYIGLDARLTTVPAWLSDYTATGLTATNSSDVSFVLYSKDVTAGETVTLGANGQSAGVVNYIAAVTEQTAEPEGIVGDLNADGAVDRADLSLIHDYLLRRSDTVPSEADLNGDGQINVFDLTIIKQLILR
ncbi:MAG: pectate lyase [Ruminococcus sp.]|nr:pectate lyase [Ruminococcus sp.]